MELWRLLAHNHWLTLNILGHDIRVCARCSGYTLGFTAPFLVFNALGVEPMLMGVAWQLVCLLLALPLSVDWVTQSWGLRRSSNSVRLFTGILLGLDLFIYSRLGIGMEAKKLVFVAAALTVALIGKLRIPQLNKD